MKEKVTYFKLILHIIKSCFLVHVKCGLVHDFQYFCSLHTMIFMKAEFLKNGFKESDNFTITANMAGNI